MLLTHIYNYNLVTGLGCVWFRRDRCRAGCCPSGAGKHGQSPSLASYHNYQPSRIAHTGGPARPAEPWGYQRKHKQNTYANYAIPARLVINHIYKLIGTNKICKLCIVVCNHSSFGHKWTNKRWYFFTVSVKWNQMWSNICSLNNHRGPIIHVLLQIIHVLLPIFLEL
jgi:hypothetical protein